MGGIAPLVRALVWATSFIALFLVFLPSRVLQRFGMVAARGRAEAVAALAVVVAGAALALWCVLAFALLGRGTPAPFDPPRQLVVRGPYRYVRNPMYIAAGATMAGAAWYFHSLPLLGYVGLFLVVAHLFVVGYEEPALRRRFGGDYAAYCSRVRRWMPGRPASPGR